MRSSNKAFLLALPAREVSAKARWGVRAPTQYRERAGVPTEAYGDMEFYLLIMRCFLASP